MPEYLRYQLCDLLFARHLKPMLQKTPHQTRFEPDHFKLGNAELILLVIAQKLSQVEAKSMKHRSICNEFDLPC